MMLPIRPNRGGFLRPFGCGWFVREFLLGRRPEDSPIIDPETGACQEDIFYHYKLALHRAYAEDAVAWENEERIKKGKPIYTPEEYHERLEHLLSKIPYKLSKCRYHSFQRYFHWLKQPRVYYCLSRRGREARDYEWSNPQLTLYPERGRDYFREKRRSRSYLRRKPTKSRKT